jgi:hypothetical protein
MSDWMIYGASGYTGGLISREAVKRGLRPVMAGRSRKKLAALAEELQLPLRVFHLEDAVHRDLEGMRLVLNCAGPFSATARPLVEACLKQRMHYLDLTAEIDVFEYVHRQDGRARDAAIVLCSGVGFDVVPTDCIAAKLKSVLPDATHLALGFDTSATMSPGTAKTMVEGYPQGGKVRRDGQIVALRTDKWRGIDFGNGEKLATTIPWGDVSTAWHSTGIPNIEVYAAIPEAMRRTMWLARTLRSALRPRDRPADAQEADRDVDDRPRRACSGEHTFLCLGRGPKRAGEDHNSTSRHAERLQPDREQRAPGRRGADEHGRAGRQLHALAALRGRDGDAAAGHERHRGRVAVGAHPCVVGGQEEQRVRRSGKAPAASSRVVGSPSSSTGSRAAAARPCHSGDGPRAGRRCPGRWSC